MLYTGPLDELFGYAYGRLTYRSLDFVFETLKKEYAQLCGTVNYTVSENYTRITEFKKLTGQTPEEYKKRRLSELSGNSLVIQE